MSCPSIMGSISWYRAVLRKWLFKDGPVNALLTGQFSLNCPWSRRASCHGWTSHIPLLTNQNRKLGQKKILQTPPQQLDYLSVIDIRQFFSAPPLAHTKIFCPPFASAYKNFAPPLYPHKKFRPPLELKTSTFASLLYYSHEPIMSCRIPPL